MLDAQTQTQLTDDHIERVLIDNRRLKQAKYSRTHQKKKRAKMRMADQVGKRMAEHIVRAVQKTVSPEGKGNGDGPGKREGKGEGPREDDNDNDNGG